MAFKKLLASLGAGGASVETVLHEVNVVPGGVVQGEVRIQGGSVNQQIEGLSVGLQAKVEVENGDQEYKQEFNPTRTDESEEGRDEEQQDCRREHPPDVARGQDAWHPGADSKRSALQADADRR